jgi:hypothetical protein
MRNVLFAIYLFMCIVLYVTSARYLLHENFFTASCCFLSATLMAVLTIKNIRYEK